MSRNQASLTLDQQVQDLRSLLSILQQAHTLREKLTILNDLPVVQDYLASCPASLKTFLAGLNLECDYAIKSVIAIGQGPIVFNMQKAEEDQFDRLRKLVQQLISLDQFYQYMGGIIGYHATILSMILEQEFPSPPSFEYTHYIHPEGLFLNQEDPEVKQAVRWGIENLPYLAEIYPVGGAGDRLNLIDEKTGTPLPAAVLPFLGLSLLEGLIRDLEAREYLYFKLHGKQICLPVAMMTSTEKNNHSHILNICQRNHWFGRPSENFYFFIQPLVPVITKEGYWSLSSYLTLTLKPGGHGVIWKLAQEQGVFDWLAAHGIQQAIVRQINNPLAGTDNSLLGLIGIGCKQDKAMGFVSCKRLLNAAEGTNVLIEKQVPDGFEYCLTNIEYTDFASHGVGEEPAKPGSPFSIYPTNTNILFIHIPSIQKALKECPIPGQLINMKSKVSYINPEGNICSVPGGRLESTMQNIADCIIDRFPHQLQRKEFIKQLSTFIVYNERQKTISTTKKSYKPGESALSTPEQAYYDILSNNHHLLEQQCHFHMPKWQAFEEFLQKGPPCIFLFHPGLGPLYSIIKQKVRHGSLKPGSELYLEIAEVDIAHLHLDGSLVVESPSPLGQKDSHGFLQYGHESRCLLHHVHVVNRGIDRKQSLPLWKNQIERTECVKIVLKEGSEFYAEHVLLKGSLLFEVPPHHRLTLKPKGNGDWIEELVSIEKPSWKWNYQFNETNDIQLQKG